MPKRFYFDDNTFWDGGGSNPATPAYYAGWHETNSALRVKLRDAKPNIAFSQMTIQKNVAGFPKYGLNRVYVSDPLPKGFTITGTIRGQFTCQEQNAANDEMRALVVRVWNSTSNTFRTPALLVHLPTVLASEFNAITTQNRFFPPETVVTPVNILKGDRIVVEIGTAFFTNNTGAGVTNVIRTGSQAGDLPVDEAYTTPELSPWIEFSIDFPGQASLLSKSAIKVGGAGLAPAGGLDYLFELVSPEGVRYDVTERTALDGISRLTLAAERNLHDFRCGDLSVTFDDFDGFFTELFSLLKPSDRWHLNVERTGHRHFTGVVPGIDSVSFESKQATCEVHAMDLAKAMEDVSAETVARPANVYSLGADVAASATSVTLNSTAGLYNGDRISFSDDTHQEEVEIALIQSGTVAQLAQAVANAYVAADTVVVLTTPFYRYQTPGFLVNALLDAVAPLINGRDVRLAAPASRVPIFSEMSTNRLGAQTVPNAWTQHLGNQFARVGTASFEQTTPDADWTSVTDRKYIDWTPYRTQAQGEPSMFAAAPAAVVGLADFGTDFTSGALVIYETRVVPGFTQQVELNKFTSADGITWSARTFVATLGDTGGVAMSQCTHDYDSTRNRVYYQWRSNLAGTQEFGYWDVGGAAKVIIDTSDNRTSKAGSNVRYSKEADLLVVYNRSQEALEFWRDVSILNSYSGEFVNFIDVKQVRFFGGAWYGVGFVRGIPSVMFSDDEWATVTQIQLAGKPSTGALGRQITIVNGTVRVVVNGNTTPGASARALMFVGASSFAGTITYADFEGQSVVNALDDLAILLNALLWVDVDGVAHFVLRTLDSLAQQKVFTDPVERKGDPIWQELYDYVEFALPDGQVASAGKKTSTSRNLAIDCQVVSTFPVATAAALYIHDFFSKQRKHATITVDDDGTVYGILDPVQMDGVDFLVYSVERDLNEFVVSLELIERVA